MEIEWKTLDQKKAMQAHDEKRGLIMTEAARFFSQNGYHGTSLSAVAKALGVSKPTLYYYFPDKAALLFACAAAAHEGAVRIAEGAALSDARAIDALRTLLKAYARHVLVGWFHFVMFLEPTSLRPDDATAIQALRDRFDSSVRALLKRAVEEGDIIAPDPKLAGFALVGAVNWMARWFDPAGTLSMEDAVEIVVRTAIEGVTTKSSIAEGVSG